MFIEDLVKIFTEFKKLIHFSDNCLRIFDLISRNFELKVSNLYIGNSQETNIIFCIFFKYIYFYFLFLKRDYITSRRVTKRSCLAIN